MTWKPTKEQHKIHELTSLILNDLQLVKKYLDGSALEIIKDFRTYQIGKILNGEGPTEGLEIINNYSFNYMNKQREELIRFNLENAYENLDKLYGEIMAMTGEYPRAKIHDSKTGISEIVGTAIKQSLMDKIKADTDSFFSRGTKT